MDEWKSSKRVTDPGWFDSFLTHTSSRVRQSLWPSRPLSVCSSVPQDRAESKEEQDWTEEREREEVKHESRRKRKDGLCQIWFVRVWTTGWTRPSVLTSIFHKMTTIHRDYWLSASHYVLVLLLKAVLSPSALASPLTSKETPGMWNWVCERERERQWIFHDSTASYRLYATAL